MVARGVFRLLVLQVSRSSVNLCSFVSFANKATSTTDYTAGYGLAVYLVANLPLARTNLSKALALQTVTKRHVSDIDSASAHEAAFRPEAKRRKNDF